MLDLRRLRLLRELHIRGTLAAVAEALNYSPSAVSQQLALLEREAGIRLLQRSGRRLYLTAQAEILVEHTTALLERLEQAEADMAASLTSVGGVVRIAVFQSALLALMPEALSVLSREYPDLRVEMAQREPESALFETWSRDFDLVMAEQYPGHAAPRLPGLDREKIASDTLRLAIPPTGAGARIRSIADAEHFPWVMEPSATASRHWAQQICRQSGFEPDVRYETPDLHSQIRLIESGNAVAILPDLIWTGRRPVVGLVDIPDAPRRTVFTSVRHASRNRPAIRACREVLTRVAQQLTDAVP